MKTDYRYKQIFENMEEGYYEANLKGEFTLVNNAVYKIYGHTKDEVIGTGYERYVDKDTAKLISEAFTKIYTTGRPATIEYEAIRKDGTGIFVRNSGSLLTDETGKTIGFHGLILDITERKKAEQTLKESAEKYRTILEDIEEGYYEVDLKGNFTFFNDSLCKISGYSRDELLGMNNQDYTTPETAKRIYRIFNEIYQTENPAKIVDYEIIKKDGSIRVIEISVSLMKDPSGRLMGFRGVTRDITERKEVERALEETSARF
ncbi:MAG: PAS domain-containing protein, partial [Thermodesulfobacteriota bacterium]|nr:PAS domain-containing protein [Thermodesulfobacteriota bacterium]